MIPYVILMLTIFTIAMIMILGYDKPTIIYITLLVIILTIHYPAEKTIINTIIMLTTTILSTTIYFKKYHKVRI